MSQASDAPTNIYTHTHTHTHTHARTHTHVHTHTRTHTNEYHCRLPQVLVRPLKRSQPSRPPLHQSRLPLPPPVTAGYPPTTVRCSSTLRCHPRSRASLRRGNTASTIASQRPRQWTTSTDPRGATLTRAYTWQKSYGSMLPRRRRNSRPWAPISGFAYVPKRRPA